MECNIVLSGVGGQGILSIAAALGAAAVDAGLYIKQAETHGMSQRGGAVQSYMRISDKPIFSDLIATGTANLILSVEPMESLRYLPFLSEEGYVVSNSVHFNNIANYPDYDAVIDRVKELPRSILFDADSVAKEIGSVRASNMVILGAATPFIDIDIKHIEAGIREIFSKKGDKIVDLNLKAIRAGREYALNAI